MRQFLHCVGYKGGKRYYITELMWGRKDHDENPEMQFNVGHYPEPRWYDRIGSRLFKLCFSMDEVLDYLQEAFGATEQPNYRNPDLIY